VLGVLNLHHRARVDAFSDADLAFTEELARLDAQIIARAQQHEALSSRPSLCAVQDVSAILAGREPLADRLRRLCEWVAARTGGGIATIYQVEHAGGGPAHGRHLARGGHRRRRVRVALARGIDGQVAQTRRGPRSCAIPTARSPRRACRSRTRAARRRALDPVRHRPPRGRAAEETLLEIAATARRKLDGGARGGLAGARDSSRAPSTRPGSA